MNNRFILLNIFAFLVFVELFAQKVDTLNIYSKKMDTIIPNLVILPDDYSKDKVKKYPVVYLLHGFGANYTTWASVIKKNLPELATQYQLILVCPDGKNSWYWDSPFNTDSQYETYISKELIPYIDSVYHTLSQKQGRAITGFSMGGHGALWLTIQFPHLFGACGSTSGAVDFRPFPMNWEINKQIGEYENNRKLWESHTVMTQIEKLKNKNKAILIDCGDKDFFIEANYQLHKKMSTEGIEHTFSVQPGGHTPRYWNRSIDWQLQFFSHYFRSQQNRLK